MEKLKLYPEYKIEDVAKLTGIPREKLRDAQIEFVKRHTERRSRKWNQTRYGKLRTS